MMSYSTCQFTWLKQKETLVSLAESLLQDENFFDCQLCAEGHRFNVHRVILSCNSPVLNNILQEHNLDSPVITLDGVSSIELAALVEFMYTGVTKISPDHLKTFFQTAKTLQLAGLTHYDSSQIEKIVNENGSTIVDSTTIDNYELYSQNILKYLNQPDVNNETTESKNSNNLSTNVDNIFLEEAEEGNNLVNSDSIMYEKYDCDYIKEEENIETLDPNLIESDVLSPSCANGNPFSFYLLFLFSFSFLKIFFSR